MIKLNSFGKILLIALLFSLNISAQNDSKSYEIKFYKNGVFKNPEKIQFSIITEKDTLNCVISNRKITISDDLSSSDVVITHKKDSYLFKDMKFSELHEDSVILFGVEKDRRNFHPSFQANFYFHDQTQTGFMIEKLDTIKQISFLCFKREIPPEGIYIARYTSFNRLILELR